MNYSVILLAAGNGTRMGGAVKKQYMTVAGEPLIVHALRRFEESDAAEIVLVVSPGDEDYVRECIVEAYGMSKVSDIVPGGDERYLSVREGLRRVTRDYVLVHDGARCCVTNASIAQAAEAAMRWEAAVIAVPSVDTVKIADEEGFVTMTPERSHVWSIQTPQAFRTTLLMAAYEKLDSFDGITDDAMLVERAFPEQRIRLVMGSYDNIKVTTTKDIAVAEKILQETE